MATAIAALQSLRPAMIFKKIDSILRGNVGAEIVAALRATGCRHAFISPAIPNQKRVMREGTVYLSGAPVPTRRAGRPIPKCRKSLTFPISSRKPVS